MIIENRNRDIDIFRQLTNNSEGIIDITSSTLVFSLIDHNEYTVFQKTPTVIEGTYGIAKVAINASDTVNLGSTDYTMEWAVDGNSVLLETLRFRNVNTETTYIRSGTTANRPSLPSGQYVGFNYFDTTLGRELQWDGSAWVDSIDTLNDDVETNTTNIADLRTDLTTLDDNARVVS